jgi:hypothetical protein
MPTPTLTRPTRNDDEDRGYVTDAPPPKPPTE